jgi:hypothetical protein
MYCFVHVIVALSPDERTGAWWGVRCVDAIGILSAVEGHTLREAVLQEEDSISRGWEITHGDGSGIPGDLLTEGAADYSGLERYAAPDSQIVLQCGDVEEE